MNGELAAAFPLPPRYYKNYEIEGPPPPEPIEGPFEMFGQIQNIEVKIPSLESLGFEDLGFEDKPPKEALLELRQSIMTTFTELLHTLATDTTEFQPKIDQLRKQLIVMHHKINEYRPHQARETLILMMEDQVKRRREQANAILQKIQDTQERLDQLKSNSTE